MTGQNGEPISGDLIIFRLEAIETQLTRLNEVLITKEHFNELSNEIRDYRRKVDRLEARMQLLMWVIVTAGGAMVIWFVQRILNLI